MIFLPSIGMAGSWRARAPVARMMCFASTVCLALSAPVTSIFPLETILPKPVIDVDLVLAHQELDAFAHLVGHAAAALDDRFKVVLCLSPRSRNPSHA
jgi:hypothetical protein